VMALFVLQRLYLPAFARLQNEKDQLKSLVENVIWATNAITAPFAILTMALIVPITATVYGPKWLVALPYFYLLWPANLFVCSVSPIMGLVNALGKSRIALYFLVISMVITWLVGAPLIWKYGAIGFPIANVCVQAGAFWLFRSARRLVPFRILPVVAPVWGMAAVAGLFTYMACRLKFPHEIVSLVAYGCFGLFLYGAGVYFVFKRKIRAGWALLRKEA
jgi:O-antigen/teichoic acid export membrane protein